MKHLPGKPIDFAQRYEDLAAAWARHLDKPFTSDYRDFQLINMLWTGIYPETLDDIEANPHLFGERVAMYRLANHSVTKTGEL
jgi:hypothetical protein